MKTFGYMRISLVAPIFLLVSSCTHTPMEESAGSAISGKNPRNAESLFIVDCLLPGQIRKLGQSLSYLTARRPTKTTAGDCEIRGGEYVSYDRANYATALKTWLPKAQNGEPEAQTYVGEIYEKGLGVVPDYRLASKWYRKAADQGYARAQINLGYLYEAGLNGERDLVTAMNWYRKASGLEDDEIGFASTIETSVRAEFEEQIAVLNSELARGKNELKAQKENLKRSQKALDKRRKKLDRVRQELKKTRKQLEVEKSTSDGEAKSPESEKNAEDNRLREARLSATRQQVAKLESALKTQSLNFNAKLKEAEQRTSLLNQEIARYQKENSQFQVQVEQTRSQLEGTKINLAKLNNEYERGQEDITAERGKLEKTRKQLENLTNASNSTLQENLKKYERDIQLKEAELAKTYQEAQRLEVSLKKQNSDFNAKLKQAERRTAELNKEIARRQKENTALQDKVSETRSQLGKTENKLTALSQNYQLEKAKFLGNKQKTDRLNDSQLKEKERMLVKLETDLSASEKQYAGQRKRIDQLEQRIGRYKSDLSVKNTKAPSGKPSIEIIEPTFVVTRGIPTFKLRSIMPYREIVGRIKAPDGLLSFNVNGVKTEINEAGLFTARIRLNPKETKVKTVVIDKKGNLAELNFLLLSSSFEEPKKQEAPTSLSRGIPEIDFGTDHALIIGNQDYKYIQPLNTPVGDAKAVAKILRDNYGFKTNLLINGDRYAILSALNELRGKLTENDNLLIYYAGHGEYDKVNLRGHWLPVDAEQTSTANWISTVAITDILNAMSAMHVLVIADSCYSGALTRASVARIQAGMSLEKKIRWLKVMAKTRSRTVLTSGSLEPVLDDGANGHSIFANALIAALSENDGVLDGSKLYAIVNEKVQQATRNMDFKQAPQYAPIKFSGHEAGDFFLVRNRQLSSKEDQTYIAGYQLQLANITH